MTHSTIALLFVVALFLGMVTLIQIGRRAGSWAPQETVGLGTAQGAIFALLGLLLAFTFSGAAERFNVRRQLIVQEANAIGTAYLRVDLLPMQYQEPLREKFRSYVDARIAVVRAPDLEVARSALDRAAVLQGDIWRQAVAACRDPEGGYSALLVIPALNDVIDITTTRLVAAETHAPLIIFGMIGVMALLCSLLAGYEMAKSTARAWLQVGAFPVILAVTLYVILDLEYPRSGLITLQPVDQVVVDLRASMK
jgi:hypothetical protein